MKITFIGDVMCEMPLLKAAKKNGAYHFDTVFSGTKKLFDKSDLVVANLETPLAGKSAGYTKDLFSFNTPVEFLDSLAMSGIGIVQTANNHCLDRGTTGLLKTMEELDKRRIPYFGTACKPGSHYLIQSIDATKVALLGYTMTTNYSRNREMIGENNSYLVNLMMPFGGSAYGVNISDSGMKHKLTRMIPGQWKLKVKRRLGKNVREIRTDKMTEKSKQSLYLEEIKTDIQNAKKEADLVLCCFHMGGQFNVEPGELTQYVMDEISQTEVDAIICSHPHIIQRIEICNGTPCAFSLGNYSMSPSSPYLVMENMPEYGLAFHIYSAGSKIDKISVTVLKMTEDQKGMISVKPLNEIYSSADQITKENLKEDMKKVLAGRGGILQNSPLESYLEKEETTIM